MYIGLGANLPHPKFGPPTRTLRHALARLNDRGVRVVRRSPWYRTAPVPASDQPWYINAVAEVATGLGPDALLATMHGIEDDFGRVRSVRNAPRFIDLDLVDYRSIINRLNYIGISIIPHVKLEERAFVLLPLRDIAPDWRHPLTGAAIDALIAALPAGQAAERLPA
ncbi:MAG: 2-amino-4-hydroxy-6-hydroxymethyldihydropteridine diphosphokinase [Alphaproteobacteria bacterium]|nr:2-amino-4-hydroxy-6-hydroxymethyldihydropteridine diphosphokinase [Alphaproteobacteria bacterium]MCW5739504.1 2-amino-4-hydroxy-6-hydroxymethyldihydropteridine diphosphokinase [Alphaproteobacteria bacterium]